MDAVVFRLAVFCMSSAENLVRFCPNEAKIRRSNPVGAGLNSLLIYVRTKDTVSIQESAFLTVQQVARRLNIGRSKTYELILSGEIPSFLIGKRSRRVSVSQLEAYIERLEGGSV